MRNLDEATKEIGPATEPSRGHARPADPKLADDERDSDLEAAVARAEAPVGKALAVLAKLHRDLTCAGDVIPGEREAAEVHAEGGSASDEAILYVDLLVDHRTEERRLQALVSSADAPEKVRS